MKQLFRVAMLGCVITVLLSALSLQTAEAKVPLARSGGSYLYGVAAVSAKDVWAVGFYLDQRSNTVMTLIEQWNGKKWSVVPSPSPGTAQSGLSGVAAVSATDVWAVGNYQNNDGSGGTLIEQWNGTQWSVIPSPSPGSSNTYLSGVAAVSATDVWAVGGYYNSDGTGGTLIEQWNGTQWSVVSNSSPGSSNSALTGVAAVSATDIWAVGYYANNAYTSETLVEQWNGTQWSVVSSPSPGSFSDFLGAVAVVSATDVWAVGYDSGKKSHTLTEHWNGSRWSVVKSPSP